MQKALRLDLCWIGQDVTAVFSVFSFIHAELLGVLLFPLQTKLPAAFIFFVAPCKKTVIMDKLVILVIIFFISALLICMTMFPVYIMMCWLLPCSLCRWNRNQPFPDSRSVTCLCAFTKKKTTSRLNFDCRQFNMLFVSMGIFRKVYKSIIKMRDLNLCVLPLVAALSQNIVTLMHKCRRKQTTFHSVHTCWCHCVNGWKKIWQVSRSIVS